MNRVLRKRILRDIKENFRRWPALFPMIVLGMYVVVAVLDAAENIITGSADIAEKNNVEDGEFSVFLPLTDEQENSLCDMAVESELFGTAFVTSEQYEEILKNDAKNAEDYTYAYRLVQKRCGSSASTATRS
ncbi:MAG: hypothetical protein HDR72_04145 [Ruminococcaceae bacterium]|nr:hypothetical protein [Oscillospiraceae bacterium]